MAGVILAWQEDDHAHLSGGNFVGNLRAKSVRLVDVADYLDCLQGESRRVSEQFSSFARIRALPRFLLSPAFPQGFTRKTTKPDPR